MENAKIIIELYNEDSRYGITSENSVNKKAASGISQLISEKSELQVKYDRLLKDYELARHECKQKTEHIEKLEEEHESLLKKISKLHEEQAGFDNAYSVLKDEICKKDLEIKRLKGYLEKLFF